jgi:hypothetical protein
VRLHACATVVHAYIYFVHTICTYQIHTARMSADIHIATPPERPRTDANHAGETGTDLRCRDTLNYTIYTGVTADIRIATPPPRL